MRALLASAPEELLDRVLDERELESLRFGYRERVTDTELAHIRELPEVLPDIFAAAAGRAREAGFDGVELHYAHAYTMASFLSARNTREDGYGGARENRVRLPLEIYRAVRERVGPDYIVGVRFLSDEVIEGGNRVNDASYFGVEFARAGFDYLLISKGGKSRMRSSRKSGRPVYPYTGQSGYECMPTVISDARARSRAASLWFRHQACGQCGGSDSAANRRRRYHNLRAGRKHPQRGEADIAGFARQALATLTVF